MPFNTARAGHFPYHRRRSLGKLHSEIQPGIQIPGDKSEKPTMTLDIMRNGLVHRLEDGSVTILRPGRNGGPGEEIEVERGLADAYGLASGDIVEGSAEPIETSETSSSPECLEDWAVGDEERDEPAAVRGATIPDWLMTRCMPTERLVSLTRINGLCVEQAQERPSPRLRRNTLERAAPDRRVALATGPA